MAIQVQSGATHLVNPRNGLPLTRCQIYIGEVDTDPKVVGNQQNIYAVIGSGNLRIPQPLETNQAGILHSSGIIHRYIVDRPYSMTVERDGEQLYYFNRIDEFNVTEVFNNFVATIPRYLNTKADLQGESRTDRPVQILGETTVGDGLGGPLRVYVSGSTPGTYAETSINQIILPLNGDGSSAWVPVSQGVQEATQAQIDNGTNAFAFVPPQGIKKSFDRFGSFGNLAPLPSSTDANTLLRQGDFFIDTPSGSNWPTPPLGVTDRNFVVLSRNDLADYRKNYQIAINPDGIIWLRYIKRVSSTATPTFTPWKRTAQYGFDVRHYCLIKGSTTGASNEVQSTFGNATGVINSDSVYKINNPMGASTPVLIVVEGYDSSETNAALRWKNLPNYFRAERVSTNNRALYGINVYSEPANGIVIKTAPNGILSSTDNSITRADYQMTSFGRGTISLRIRIHVFRCGV